MKKIINKIIILLISVYQHTLSRDHGWLKILSPHGACRFYPTCSEYTRQAVIRFGVLKGLYLGFKRIFKCHPFSIGGYDPLPDKNN
jgi:putative membrane protein insertion efficiency factor